MFDGFWDPYAYDTDHLRYFIHRTWRDDLYVRQMVERKRVAGQGERSECPWTLEDMLKGSGSTARDQAWEQRQRSAGARAGQQQGQARRRMHEVWEFHDGDRVITVLDGVIPVQIGENPYWHRRIPFLFWRPRRVPHEFVGIGIIEPIEMLHDELMAMRGSRADNAMLVLQRVFAFYDGLVDPEALKFGPGLAIPVNGDPRELLYPIEMPDIPNSGYQEEDRLLAELERASALSDTDQVSMMQGTATGAQLLSAQVNLQTQLMAQLLEAEVVGPLAEMFFELDQQKIVKTRTVPGRRGRRMVRMRAGRGTRSARRSSRGSSRSSRSGSPRCRRWARERAEGDPDADGAGRPAGDQAGEADRALADAAGRRERGDVDRAAAAAAAAARSEDPRSTRADGRAGRPDRHGGPSARVRAAAGAGDRPGRAGTGSGDAGEP
jgi:hypothetical protein